MIRRIPERAVVVAIALLAAVLIALALAGCSGRSDLAPDRPEIQPASAPREDSEGLRDLFARADQHERSIRALRDELARTRADLRELGQRADQRANFLEELSDAEASGLMGAVTLLAGVGVNVWRNYQRRRRGEPVRVSESRGASPSP